MTAAIEGDAQRYPSEWLRVSEGLIGGIHHALNNRMAALGGAAQVLESDLPSGHPLAGVLTRELQRLEKTATLLRLLTGGDGPPEPIHVPELLSDARQLFEVHHDLRERPLTLNVQEGILPLRTQPAGLLRAILLMLSVAADGDGGSGEIGLSASGDDVRIDLVVESTGREHEGASGAALVGDAGPALEELARRLGGEFRSARIPAGMRLTLTLPTLVEALRLERG